MDDTVKLLDLGFISAEGHGEKYKKQAAAIKREFDEACDKTTAFIKRVAPYVDNVCKLNKHLSKRASRLTCDGEQVPASAFDCLDCIAVCEKAVSDFPAALKTMTAALRMGADVRQISVAFCRAYNTAVEFLLCAQRLCDERIERIEPDDDDTDDFSKVISLPIGKADGKEISIELDVDGPDAHAVISGKTGTGKSSFLQSVILGGAYRYSPDKLRFWILDFKDGNGLIQFKDLKHVGMMSVKNRAADSGEIVEFIKAERDRRFSIIREINGGDIIRYNRIARESGKPVLPRLIIVIDEFTVMSRECFGALTDVAKRGRSIGMSFILSSQIVERGSASYGDAIAQANHFFEYQNEGMTFGRLIGNATDAERAFVESGKKGRCVYRRNNDRYKMTVAYAGQVEEQERFIKKINDKWSAFPPAKPIITGSPERIIKRYDEISADATAAKNAFAAEKKVVVPIGETRSGKQYLYKIDRNNPLLVVFGDEARAASVEYSAVKQFECLAGASGPSVYYIDLNCNPDREKNPITAAYGGAAGEKVRYTATDGGAKSMIDAVYNEMQRRMRQTRGDKSGDIGNPIELVVHGAERIVELKGKPQTYDIKLGVAASAAGAAQADDLSLLLGDIAEPEPQIDENKDAVEQLREIIFNGKNARIYVMLYFEERNLFAAASDKILGYNYGFKDVLVIPYIPEDGATLSAGEVTDALTACRLREQAAAFDAEKLEKSDFYYAALVDDKTPWKIIPYEWEC